MIPIQFKENEKDTVNKLSHILLRVEIRQHHKNKYRSNIRSINTWCKENIEIDGKGLTFPQIIKADFETLGKIAEILDKLSESQHKELEQYKEFLIKKLYKQKFPRNEFMESLGVTVCPYCNRNFVNSAKKRTMCDLDHFYNKDKYPLLAVSFYNLIPVCHSCNHAKGTNDIKYSPHDKRYKTNDLVNFDFYLKGMDFLYNSKDIGIEIEESKQFEQNIKVLKLCEVYQIHSDIVQDCIKKAIMFNPEYLDYLYAEYCTLFESKNELYKIVFGNYINEDSFGERPLAKLTHDIIENLFEIYYGIKL